MDGMRDVKVFPFFNSVKNPVSAAGTSDSYYNAGYDLLTLEVSNATAISAVVEGCVNQLGANGLQLEDSECNWTELAILKATDYSKLSKIGANGIYYIGINGCARVRVKVESISGTAKIVGAMEK